MQNDDKASIFRREALKHKKRTIASMTSSLAEIIQPSAIQRIFPALTVVELAFSISQQTLFVSAPDWKDESRSKILRINSRTMDVEAEISLPVKGFGVALDDTGRQLYISQGFNGSVAVVDIVTSRLISTIPLMEKVIFHECYRRENIKGDRLAFLLGELERFGISEGYPWKLREVVFDPQSRRLFLPGLGLGINSVLFVVDSRKGMLETVIHGFGYNVVGITLDQAGRRIFLSNMQGQLFTVNADTLAVMSCYETEADQLLNMVYDPQQDRLFGVDQGIDRSNWRNNHLERNYMPRSQGHQVFVLNPNDGQILARMATDEIPVSLILDNDRQRLFVANRRGIRVEKGEGTLSVFDTGYYRHLQTMPLHPHPNSLAFDERKQTLFVTVKNDETAIREQKPECVVKITLNYG